jgi:hypothetical protein
MSYYPRGFDSGIIPFSSGYSIMKTQILMNSKENIPIIINSETYQQLSGMQIYDNFSPENFGGLESVPSPVIKITSNRNMPLYLDLTPANIGKNIIGVPEDVFQKIVNGYEEEPLIRTAFIPLTKWELRSISSLGAFFE